MPSLRGNPLRKRAFPERRAANRERAAAPDFRLSKKILTSGWTGELRSPARCRASNFQFEPWQFRPKAKPQNPADSAPPTTPYHNLLEFSFRKLRPQIVQGRYFSSGKWDFPSEKYRKSAAQVAGFDFTGCPARPFLISESGTGSRSRFCFARIIFGRIVEIFRRRHFPRRGQKEKRRRRRILLAGNCRAILSNPSINLPVREENETKGRFA